MLNNLEMLMNKAVNEGLKKKLYSKLLENIRLGVELEMVASGEMFDYYTFDEDTDFDITNSYPERYDFILGEIVSLVIEDTNEWYKKLYKKDDNLFEEDIFKTISENMYVNNSYNNAKYELLKIHEHNKYEINEIEKVLIDILNDLVEKRDNIQLSIFDKGRSLRLSDFYQDQIEDHGLRINELNDYTRTLDEEYHDLLGFLSDAYNHYVETALEDINDANFERLIDELQYNEVNSIPNSKQLFDDDGGLTFHNDKTYTHWIALGDSSIKPIGVEFISPVYSYEDFVDKIPKVCNALQDDGFISNESCGYHIGISFKNKNIVNIIMKVYQKYLDAGYNYLTSQVMAVDYGFERTFNHNPERLFNSFTTTVLTRLMKLNIDLSKYSVKDLMYSEDFDITDITTWLKYQNINLLHSDYVELRTLGNEEGFEILKNKERLESFLYDAISQVWSGTNIKSAKEVYKTMSKFYTFATTKEVKFDKNRKKKEKKHNESK